MKNFKIEIKWALIFTAAAILWSTVEKATGLHDAYIGKQAIYSVFFALPAVAIYVFALLEKKKKYFNGNMSWQQGFISGIFLSLFVAVMSPISNYVSFALISPEYFPNMIKHVVGTHVMTEASAQANLNLQSTIKRGVFDAMSMGVITSAVVALFVKTKNTTT